MRQQTWKPVILAIASLSLSAVFHTVMRKIIEEHHDKTRRSITISLCDAARRSSRRQPGDPAVQYRHDHPRASGAAIRLFTTTADRGRGSKHGGSMFG